MKATLIRLVALLALLVSSGSVSESIARPQPATLSPEEIREFLLTAKIVAHRDLSKGVTRPIRLTLTNGTLTHDAVFSSVDEHVPVMKFASGRTEVDFVDSYRYNIAAYRIAELLGLDGMMPVTVERQWDGRKGSLVWWIDTLMDEETRLKRKVPVPDSEAWNHQMYRLRVFGQLVADSDRNLGNVLIDRDWKIWMIDFTRAFRRTRTPPVPSDLERCDRQLLERLRGLTAEAVKAQASPFIGRTEIETLIARRDAIVRTFEKLIAERGEARVLY
jgi:hypothetical protein